MTHTEPANPKGRSDDEIRADLDAWENAEPASDFDDRAYLDRLSERLVDDVAPLLAAVAAARSDADQLRTENERLRGEIDALNDDSDHAIDARAESEEWYSQQIDAARVEVDTLRAKIAEATAAGIGAARIGKEIAIRHEYDAWLSELRDIEKQLMTLAGAVPGSPLEPAAEGPWAVDLIDCGRDDGVQVCATWAEADDFRQSYVAAAEGKQHCERQAIVHRAVAGTRLGYHDRAPYLAADPVVPGSPETRQEEQR